MFITTYNRANPNFKELISKHWAYLGRSSATRDFGQRDFMITYRKPPSLKDKLLRARITQPRKKTTKGCKETKCMQILQENFPIRENQKPTQQQELQYNDEWHMPNQQLDILYRMQLVPYKICRTN